MPNNFRCKFTACLFALLTINSAGAQHSSTDFLPVSTFAVFSCDLTSFEKVRGSDFFPYEVFAEMTSDSLGFAIEDVKHLKLLCGLIGGSENREPVVGWIFEFRKEIKLKTYFKDFSDLRVIDEAEVIDVDLGSAIQVNKTTVVVSESEFFAFLMSKSKGEKSEFTKMVTEMDDEQSLTMAVSVKRIENLVAAYGKALKRTDIGEQIRNELNSVKLEVKVDDGLEIQLEIMARNSRDAKSLKKTAGKLLGQLQECLVENVNQLRIKDDHYELRGAESKQRILKNIARKLEFKTEGKKLIVEFHTNNAISLLMGVFVCLDF